MNMYKNINAAYAYLCLRIYLHAILRTSKNSIKHISCHSQTKGCSYAMSHAFVIATENKVIYICVYIITAEKAAFTQTVKMIALRHCTVSEMV